MFSEGIHSLVDTGNQGLLLYGMKAAKKPADARFPFGHGKEIYFWSFVVAILIFAVGSGISIYEGVRHTLHPGDLHDPTINYIVLGLAIIFEGFALGIAIKEFNKVRGKIPLLTAVKRGKDPSMFVVLFEDAAAMAGLFVALIGITIAHWTGNAIWDGISSIVIGCILGMTAIWLAIETKGLLIGEGADKETTDGIRDLAMSVDGINHINELLTLHMGPEFIIVNISIDFKDELKTGNIETVIHTLDQKIKEQFPLVKRIFIEAEQKKDPTS